jgi:hypothetical protein
VKFKDYLINTTALANEEKEILDLLSQKKFYHP